MKKIAFFMHNFNGGGAEKVTIKVVDELSKRGYESTMIMRNAEGTLKDSVPKNIKLIDLKSNNKLSLIRNIDTVILLHKVLKKNKFDVVFGVTFHMSLILSISSFFVNKKTKIFSIMHSTISKEKRRMNNIKKILMKFFSRRFRKIIFVSNGAREDYIKNMKINEKKTITIYNPVFSKEIAKLKKEKTDCDWLEKKGDYKIIINIGRLVDVKNQKLLLRAVKILSKKEKIRVIILGEGELENELKSYAKENEISDIVMFYGFTTNPYSFLAKSDLFVLSSKYEGLGNVIIEALACGCNVVSTNCPTGPSEILDDGKYGRLTSINDEIDLAKSISYMLKDGKIDEDILINRASIFSVDNSIKKYIELIESP